MPQVTADVNDNTLRWNYDEKLRGASVAEDEGSGIAVLQTLRQGALSEVTNFLQEFNPGSASKVERARKASLWSARGCVLLPTPDESVS